MFLWRNKKEIVNIFWLKKKNTISGGILQEKGRGVGGGIQKMIIVIFAPKSVL